MTVRIRVLLIFLLLGACSSPRGVYHTVQEGQTLYRISRAYEVDERYLARINRIGDPALLRAGERLFIPDAGRVREVPSMAPSAPTRTPASSSAKKPPAAAKKMDSASPRAGRRDDTPASSGEKPKPPAPTASEKLSAAPKGKFTWPLKGEILKRFGDTAGAPSQGLEIAVPRRTPVLSAAAGRVIYSGDGIRSYGNLIILRHDDSFFTVYGFNEKNVVPTGAFVSKGDRIALSGVPPAGGKPRLYFEIRRGKEPVNPIFYLP